MLQLAILNYHNGSLLDSVEVLVNAQGGTRAYLHASRDVTPKQIEQMQQQFAKLGWIGIACSRSGQPYLELRGFKTPEELQRILVVGGTVQGTPEIVADKADPKGLNDQLKAASLKFSGYTYVLGDAAFMTYAGMELNHYYDKLAKANSNLLGRSGESLVKAIHGAQESVKGGWSKIVSGVGYALGSIILANYGSRDQSHIEISNSLEKIERFIKTEGLVDVNGGAILRHEPEKKNLGVLENANQLLRRYPSEALNIVYTGVGLALMRSSFKQIGSLRQEIGAAKAALETAKTAGHPADAIAKLHDSVASLNQHLTTEVIDVGLGSITASSAVAGIVIKEKKPMEGERKRDGIAGVWDWIQEKPLRATGYGFMLATGFHAWATGKMWLPNKEEAQALKGIENIPLFSKLPAMANLERAEILKDLQHRRKTIIGRGVFVALNVIAEVLMVMSSKGHGEGVRNDDVDESVIASTAEFVAKQDPAVRDILIERLAGYMSTNDVLGMKAEAIATNLREQVAGVANNPWAQFNPYVDTAPTVPSPIDAQAKVAVVEPRTAETKAPVTRIQTASVARQAMLEGAGHHAVGAKV